MSVSIESNVEAVDKEFARRIEMSLFAIGDTVLENAVESISGTFEFSMKAVDTGRLRASLSFVTPKGQGGISQFYPEENSEPEDLLNFESESNTVIIGTNVDYSEYVHNGTQKMSPRPFLIDGVNRSSERIEELLNQILGEEKYTLNTSILLGEKKGGKKK